MRLTVVLDAQTGVRVRQVQPRDESPGVIAHGVLKDRCRQASTDQQEP